MTQKKKKRPAIDLGLDLDLGGFTMPNAPAPRGKPLPTYPGAEDFSLEGKVRPIVYDPTKLDVSKHRIDQDSLAKLIVNAIGGSQGTKIPAYSGGSIPGGLPAYSGGSIPGGLPTSAPGQLSIGGGYGNTIPNPLQDQSTPLPPEIEKEVEAIADKIGEGASEGDQGSDTPKETSGTTSSDKPSGKDKGKKDGGINEFWKLALGLGAAAIAGGAVGSKYAKGLKTANSFTKVGGVLADFESAAKAGANFDSAVKGAGAGAADAIPTAVKAGGIPTNKLSPIQSGDGLPVYNINKPQAGLPVTPTSKLSPIQSGDGLPVYNINKPQAGLPVTPTSKLSPIQSGDGLPVYNINKPQAGLPVTPTSKLSPIQSGDGLPVYNINKPQTASPTLPQVTPTSPKVKVKVKAKDKAEAKAASPVKGGDIASPEAKKTMDSFGAAPKSATDRMATNTNVETALTKLPNLVKGLDPKTIPAEDSVALLNKALDSANLKVNADAQGNAQGAVMANAKRVLKSLESMGFKVPSGFSLSLVEGKPTVKGASSRAKKIAGGSK